MHRYQQVGDVLHDGAVAELAEVVGRTPDDVEDRLGPPERGIAARGEHHQRGVGSLQPGAGQGHVHQLDVDRGEDLAGGQLGVEGKGARLDAEEIRVGRGRHLAGHLLESAHRGQGEHDDAGLGGDLAGRACRGSPTRRECFSSRSAATS